MKYKAVIFDLYGTLVDKVPMTAYRDSLRRMAATISVTPDNFIKLWFDTYNERGLGVFQSYEDNIDYICRELGVETEASHIALAVRTEYECRARFMKPRPHAHKLLSYLKENQYKTGLITDCGAEVPKLYRDTSLAPLIDVAVFSCLVHLQKPDPGIYHIAVKQLEVRPEECLYIGDGDSNELTGAKNVGIQPVLIRDPEEDRSNVYRTDFEGDSWQGTIITSLKEVVDLLR
jgi:putative hydrolase of the HAD superfamily